MYSAIQTGQAQGMQTLDQNLQELMMKGLDHEGRSSLQGRQQRELLEGVALQPHLVEERVDMERDQAVRLTQNLLKKMVENNGSDLFITADFPPAIKIDGYDPPVRRSAAHDHAQSSLIVRSIMNDKQAKEFDATKECNFAIAPQGIGRFRVSAFVAAGSRRRGAPHDRHEDPDVRGPRAAGAAQGRRDDEARACASSSAARARASRRRSRR